MSIRATFCWPPESIKSEYGARDLRTLKLRPPLDIPAVVVRLLWWLSQRRHPHVYGLVPTCQSCNKNTKISKYKNTMMKNTKYVSKDIHTNTRWYVVPVMQLTARQYLCHKYMYLIEIPFCQNAHFGECWLRKVTLNKTEVMDIGLYSDGNDEFNVLLDVGVTLALR